jgi:hypothetical protein
MNVNSQVQIRQLLFPTYCEKPVKSFKAANPDYDARPRKPRWIDFEIHGLWGNGQPGRLAVDTTTAKGMPAASSAVLWSLVGKPGAARQALKALDEKEAAQCGQDAAADGSSGSGLEASLVSIHDDTDDEVDDDEISTGAAAGAGGGAAAAAAEVQLVPGGDLSDEQLAALQAEAASMKLGKMYAAMGGGRAGIEACLALEQLIEVRAAGECACVCLGGGGGGGMLTSEGGLRGDCSREVISSQAWGKLGLRRDTVLYSVCVAFSIYQGVIGSWVETTIAVPGVFSL